MESPKEQPKPKRISRWENLQNFLKKGERSEDPKTRLLIKTLQNNPDQKSNNGR